MIDEDLSHRPGSDREEVPEVWRRNSAAANQLQVGFVYQLEIAEHLLASQLAYGRGLYSEALREARAAVQLEDQLPYTEPPTWFFPVRHSLGRIYLRVGRARDAERVYREDLARFPENGWSLFGLAESLRRQGRNAERQDVMQRFERAWRDADVRLATSRY